MRAYAHASPNAGSQKRLSLANKCLPRGHRYLPEVRDITIFALPRSAAMAVVVAVLALGCSGSPTNPDECTRSCNTGSRDLLRPRVFLDT